MGRKTKGDQADCKGGGCVEGAVDKAAQEIEIEGRDWAFERLGHWQGKAAVATEVIARLRKLSDATESLHNLIHKELGVMKVLESAFEERVRESKERLAKL